MFLRVVDPLCSPWSSICPLLSTALFYEWCLIWSLWVISMFLFPLKLYRNIMSSFDHIHHRGVQQNRFFFFFNLDLDPGPIIGTIKIKIISHYALFSSFYRKVIWKFWGERTANQRRWRRICCCLSKSGKVWDLPYLGGVISRGLVMDFPPLKHLWFLQPWRFVPLCSDY